MLDGSYSERHRQEVLRSYTSGGRITAMPVRRPDRLVLLDHVARALEPGVRYTEPELTAALLEFGSDLAALRGGLLDEGFLERDHRTYWRCGGTVEL